MTQEAYDQAPATLKVREYKAGGKIIAENGDGPTFPKLDSPLSLTSIQRRFLRPARRPYPRASTTHRCNLAFQPGVAEDG